MNCPVCRGELRDCAVLIVVQPFDSKNTDEGFLHMGKVPACIPCGRVMLKGSWLNIQEVSE